AIIPDSTRAEKDAPELWRYGTPPMKELLRTSHCLRSRCMASEPRLRAVAWLDFTVHSIWLSNNFRACHLGIAW
ncbi:MAG: hypothetical protein WA970_05365, partial [Gammaproteobacteria bacterium]